MDCNDGSKQSWTSRNHICEDKFKSGVVGFCQDVECLSLASQFLEKSIDLINPCLIFSHTIDNWRQDIVE